MGSERNLSGLAIKVGIAGVVGFGAIATGLIASRKGRNLIREAWQGRNRTTIEDRVLEILWDDPALSRRPIDVEERDAGQILLHGEVRSDQERRLAVALTAGTRGVRDVIDHLEVVPVALRRRTRASRRDAE